MGMGFALQTKVDSNLTGLRYAHEVTIGALKGDGTDVWYQLDPNSYSGFGAQMTLTERTPINPARMRRKGVITDLAADAGFQMDLTKSNARDLLPGFFFAAWHDKWTLDPTAVTGTQYTVVGNTGGSAFTTKDLIFAANFATSSNNGLKKVTGLVSTTGIQASGLTAETVAGAPGSIPYIRRVGIEAASGDLFITVTGSVIQALSALVAVPGGSPGNEYVPGTDVLTVVGGTGTASQFNVDSTQVSAATVNAGGVTGEPDGAGYIVQGTTGTGTLFEASVTIASGTIASIQSVTVGGDYTVNPTVLTAEPVTGLGFVITGATFGLSMGVKDMSVAVAGAYTVEPPFPSATTSTGTGTGATIEVTFDQTEDIDQDTATLQTGTVSSLKSTVFDFTTLGLQKGEWFFVGGDTTATQFVESANNGFARIKSIAAHTIVVDKSSSEWVPESGASLTVRVFIGSLLKNEVLPVNIVRSTVQMERTLSTGGIEYVTGCVPDMFTITMNAASKVTCELKYVGIQTDLVSPGGAAKTGFRPNLPVSQAYNTASDFGRLALHDRSVGNSLANFMKDATLVINNGAQPVKALSRLGAIDVVVGDFQVSGAITAYFTDTATVQAVKNNDDVTIDFALVHGNSGLLFDVPLLAVGGGRLNVVKDQPIEIPVTHAGAWDPDLNWVLSCTCFDYTPNLAQ
jgi:hypothetical protein